LDYDKAMYRWRHLIENYFAKLKEFRAIATRYDKTDTSFRARAIRFSENVVADIGEWTSTWGRRALDFGGRVGYHDCNQI
jgi:hypothetical protein